MDARVLKAEISDIEVLNKISIEAKMHWNYPPEWIEKWKSDLTLTDKDFLDQSILKLELESGTIIGFCAIQEREAEYEITNLWIKPGYMGKGWGKLLLEESIQQIVLKGKPITVVADPNAEAFYSKQGFNTYDRKQSYPKDRFLPLMKKVIPPRN